MFQRKLWQQTGLCFTDRRDREVTGSTSALAKPADISALVVAVLLVPIFVGGWAVKKGLGDQQ